VLPNVTNALKSDAMSGANELYRVQSCPKPAHDLVVKLWELLIRDETCRDRMGGAAWIGLAQNRDKCRALANVVMT
jgi:hypothetical protein